MDQRIEAQDAATAWHDLLDGLADPALCCAPLAAAPPIVLAANPAAASLFGGAPSTLQGGTINAVLGDEAWAALRPVLGAGRPARVAVALRAADGSARSAMLRALPVQDTPGPPHWILLFAGAAAADPRVAWQAPESLRAILDTLPVPIFLKDVAFNVVMMNTACEEAMGFPFEAIRGTDGSQFFPPDMMAQFLAVDRQVLFEGLTVDVEERSLNARLGQETIRRTIKRPLHDDAGRPRLLIGCSIDVTERRRAEEKLRDALHALSQHNRDLRDFAHVASHDLQEPLRKIRSSIDQVLAVAVGSLDTGAADRLRRANAAAARMQQLIDALSSWAQLATGERNWQRVDLSAVAAAVADDLEALRERLDGRLRIGPLPSVRGDAVQLRQALQNLFANALKYHAPDRPPQVAVDAVAVRLDDGREAWDIAVADNGIGFDPAQAERIFAPLVRLHGRDAYEGSGLGLAIVRRVVERHGVSVRAEGWPGQGARIVMRLPAG
jgi:PAS domain S-box-containing protein